MSNQNYVFVLDTRRKPLTPCKPSMARKLLNSGKAAIYYRFPFTIILKKEVKATPDLIEIKIDPGSKTTGIALKQGDKVIFGAELTHRGQAIKASLESRCTLRRGRRNRHTRYRQARFKNRIRPKGWLAPSLQHRVETTLTWVNKFIRLAPFVQGFQTGDIVKAVVTAGEKAGEYIGRVAVRSTGSFNISDKSKLVEGINFKYCKLIHKKDGYNYGF